MISKIQQLGRGQRALIFFSVFIGGLMLLVAITFFLISFSINSGPRQLAIGIGGATVREFVTLPDDDSYPSTVAVGRDGTVYTGSYRSGAVWAISQDGELRELTDSRILIASVSSIEVAEDGTLYVLDRTDPNPAVKGGLIWRILPDDVPREFASITDGEEGFIAPHDLAIATDGVLYVTDRGRREIWQIDSEGNGKFWWRVPNTDPQVENAIPTSIAYDKFTDTLVVVATNNGLDNVYRVSRDGQQTETIYRFSGVVAEAPGFDGITIGENGRIFLANFSQNGVSELLSTNYSLLANGFRGSSSVAYFEGKLYVNNFDQVGIVNPLVQPRLPFAIDEVTLSSPAPTATESE
ncbi:MAG: hypothetical protein MUE54_02120 [Anaerolineae bacterium]|jgi:sugar lactone lactonase YvrE|nr:hypothetical protein [Anaerolineae bacterium]